MQYTVILKNWTALKPFVIEPRRQRKHPALFQELQLTVARWQASSSRKKTERARSAPLENTGHKSLDERLGRLESVVAR